MARKTGQKRKKEEKTKTQLKKSKTGPGNHLPKGTNVTKTEFKVGKIVIPRQLERGADGGEAPGAGPVTKKKLGLKDILGKLSHYSQSVRQESLDGLKELVSGQFGGSLVRDNLSLIINRLAPLTSDREKKVRRSAFAILEAILQQVEGRKLEPLFGVLIAHLSRCLTHIDPSIQQDGLSLMDSLVTAVPAFIAAHYVKILPDCLEQISSKKCDEKAKVGVSANVSDKISSLQWRIDVLKRVDKVLEAILDSRQLRQSSLENGATVDLSYDEGDLFCEVFPGRPESLCFVDLIPQTGEDAMVDIVDRILPLIIESWVEAATDTKRRGSSIVSNQVFPLLEIIAPILEKLVMYAQVVAGEDALGATRPKESALLHHIRSKYLDDLHSRLLSRLPFSNSSGRCNAQNIVLCNVATHLAGSSLGEDMLARIISLAGSQTTSPAQRLKVLASLLAGGDLCTDKRNSVLDLIVELSRCPDSEPPHLAQTIKLLSGLAEREPDRLGPWLASLPVLVTTSELGLVEPILRTILKLIQRKNPCLEKSLKENWNCFQDWRDEKSREDALTRDAANLCSHIKQNLYG